MTVKISLPIPIPVGGIGKPDYTREVSSAIEVPLDPEQINRVIMAKGAAGKAYFPTVRASWLCPPGVTDITFPMLPGWYCTSTFLTITSDFYDPNIIVEVFADDQSVTPWGITLTGPCDVSYGDYYVKKVSVRIRTTNSTAGNATLSELCYGHMLEKSFYDEFYAPIIEYTHRMLENIAKK